MVVCQCSRLEDMVSSFYYNMKVIGKVNRVYKIDLLLSLKTIPIRVVEDKIMNLVGDKNVYHLLWSFLHLPIIDQNGNNRKGTMGFTGIPAVGEISKVILNIILSETFDREFPKWFPGIRFCRFRNSVFIFTNEKVILDEKPLYMLLGEQSLVGKIESIGSGDEALMCYNDKVVFVDSDGVVQLCERTEDSF